jgi:outer membrane protein
MPHSFYFSPWFKRTNQSSSLFILTVGLCVLSTCGPIGRSPILLAKVPAVHGTISKQPPKTETPPPLSQEHTLKTLTPLTPFTEAEATKQALNAINGDTVEGSTFPTFEAFLKSMEVAHPKVLGAQQLERLAQGKYQEKQGAFDPRLLLLTDTQRYNSSFRPRSGSTYDITGSVKTRSGIEYGLTSDFSGGVPKSPGTPSGEGGTYSAFVKVPLLRGLGVNEKSVAERQALYGTWEAQAAVLQTRLDTLLAGGSAYWDIALAHQAYGFAKSLEQIATQRFSWITQRVKAGDLPDIDAVEAQQHLSTRQANTLKAARTLQKNVNKWRLYWWQADGTPQPPPVLKPDAVFPSQLPTLSAMPELPSLTEATESMLSYRPELKYLEAQVKGTQEALKLAKNNLLPEVNASIQVGRDTGSGGIGTALKAGVMLNAVPFRQREARGQILQAQSKLAKFALEKSQLLQALQVDLQDVYNEIALLKERLATTQKELQFASQMEAGERLRLELGDSTLFMVNQRELATFQTRIKLLELQGELANALLVYQLLVSPH